MANEVRKLLEKMGRWSSDLLNVVVREDRDVYLRITRGFRKWKFKYDEEYTRCEECQGTKKSIKIHKKELSISRLADLLEEADRVAQSHNAHKSHPPDSDKEESPAEGSSIKVRPPTETGGSRIKVLTSSDKEAPAASALTLSPVRPPGIKVVKEASPAAVYAEPEPESRPLEDSVPRNKECTFSLPGLRYWLSSGSRVDVTIPLPICEMLIQKCARSLNHRREVGGLLIGYQTGPGSRDGALNYQVDVSNLIEFRAADSSGAHLHLSTDSWSYVYSKYSEIGYEAENKNILGWYHTHPDQGIFFSTKDCDFHTEFRKPFQFAFVVDPQNMEAGLFYWEDYGRRALAGPFHFALKRDRETAAPASPLPISPIRESSFAPPAHNQLAWLRVLIFLAACFIVGLFILKNSASHLPRPMDICISALIVLLGLRLWNLGWFHPDEALEVNVITRGAAVLEQASRAGTATLTHTLKRVRGKTYRKGLIALIVLAILISLAFRLGIIDRLRPRPRPHSSLQVTNTPHESRPEESDPPEIRIDVGSGFNGKALLSLEVQSPESFRIEYSRRNSAADWECDLLTEREFFRKLLQWDIGWTKKPYIQKLQADLFGRSGDGVWGAQTRNAFLEKVRELREQKKPLEIMRADNQSVRMIFD